MRQHLQRIVCVALFGVSTTLPCAARIWEDAEERLLDAELIEQNDTSIKVRRASDEVVFEIPVKQLSEKDQTYLKGIKDVSVGTNPKTQSIAAAFPAGGLDWEYNISLPDDFKLKIIEEDNRAGRYVYRSNHFEFHSTVKLARKVVSKFAEIFETTFALIQASPLDWNLQTPPQHFKAQLFETETEYLAAGGMPGSAGVYKSKTKTFYVPMDKLGTKKTSTSITLDEGDYGTLIHEVTHQVQHDWLSRLPTWLIEGYAEYVESIPYENGTFRLNRLSLDKGLGERLLIEDPIRLLQITGTEWNEKFDSDSMAVSRLYRSAYLLTYYFLHLDGEGDGRRIWQYLRALESANTKETFEAAQDILIDDRTSEALFESMRRAFKREGLELEIY